MVNVTKLLPMPSHQRFYALGRVLSGTVRSGERVKVLGEHYTLENEEDMSVEEISAVYLSETRSSHSSPLTFDLTSFARYNIQVQSVPAGNFVLLEGIDTSISKTATLTEARNQGEHFIFRPLRSDLSPLGVPSHPD